MALIYHLTTHSLWAEYLKTGLIRPPYLEKEGFIHLSTKEQLLESANKHFADEEEVLVLAIPPKRVKENLKWEPARNEELFPHVYAPIQVVQVEDMLLLEKNKEGLFEWQ